MRLSKFVFAAALALSGGALRAQSTPAPAADAPASGPYKVLQISKVGGDGGFDYVDADSDGRKVYVVRSGRPGGRTSVYDLDTLKLISEFPANGGHGVAVDPKSGHGFVSSNPVVMFDTTTLQPIKSIQTEGSPDGLFYEPFKQQIYILSHGAPNVTVINASDGSIAGTIDLGGAPEEGQSDGLGHAYIDVESGDNVAVVDCATLAVTGHYDISASGTGPAGLSVDAKNRIIFSYCRTPNVCVILNADTGKVVTTLPIGVGCDAAEFNPDTLEAFSSQGDGTLTIIKENSPTDFAVEQTVKTKTGAKCSTLDLKTGHIILTTADYAAPATRPAGQAAGGGGPGGPGAGPGGGGPGGPGGAAGGGAGRRGGRGGRGRGQIVAGSFQLIEVGKE